jgi:hypothetical protein
MTTGELNAHDPPLATITFPLPPLSVSVAAIWSVAGP